MGVEVSARDVAGTAGVWTVGARRHLSAAWSAPSRSRRVDCLDGAIQSLSYALAEACIARQASEFYAPLDSSEVEVWSDALVGRFAEAFASYAPAPVKPGA